MRDERCEDFNEGGELDSDRGEEAILFRMRVESITLLWKGK